MSFSARGEIEKRNRALTEHLEEQDAPQEEDQEETQES